jgi:hypothetical protein
MKDVGRYSKLVEADTSRKTRVPIRLATATVLAALRDNRTRFSLVGASGIAQTPSGVGITLPDDVGGTPLESYQKSIENPAVLNESCQPNPANHWSDIVFHYYCLVPPIYRGCHRYAVGKYAGTSGGTLKERKEAIELCLKPVANWTDDEKKNNALAAPLQPFFPAFYASQKVTLGNGTEVNIFDYLMLSQTFAFDYADQHAVLNAFYGDLKPTGDFDPSNAAECSRYRPKRKIDSPKGNHSLASTEKLQPLFSVDR